MVRAVSVIAVMFRGAALAGNTPDT